MYQIFSSLGFGLTYFTVQFWFPLAILSLSCHAIGFSFAYATAIAAAQKWFSPQKKGLVGSIVIAGYGFGSMFWIPIQTGFVNPDNLAAEVDPNCSYVGTDSEDLCDFYFVDDGLLSRVPWMFALLGSIFIVMGVIALLLISEPTSENGGDEKEINEIKSSAKNSETTDDEESSLTPIQVLKTWVFYQVFKIIIFYYMTFTDPRCGLDFSASLLLMVY